MFSKGTQPESAIADPPVYLEIAIQGEDIAGVDLAGQVNQTGAGQVSLEPAPSST